jgi:hypothetical protein
LLDQILALGNRAHDAGQQPVRSIDVKAIEVIECPPLALHRALHELGADIAGRVLRRSTPQQRKEHAEDDAEDHRATSKASPSPAQYAIRSADATGAPCTR